MLRTPVDRGAVVRVWRLLRLHKLLTNQCENMFSNRLTQRKSFFLSDKNESIRANEEED